MQPTPAGDLPVTLISSPTWGVSQLPHAEEVAVKPLPKGPCSFPGKAPCATRAGNAFVPTPAHGGGGVMKGACPLLLEQLYLACTRLHDPSGHLSLLPSASRAVASEAKLSHHIMILKSSLKPGSLHPLYGDHSATFEALVFNPQHRAICPGAEVGQYGCPELRLLEAEEPNICSRWGTVSVTTAKGAPGDAATCCRVSWILAQMPSTALPLQQQLVV